MSTPARVPTFHFDGYTLRPTDERDRGLLEQFIADDEFHRDTVGPGFFLDTLPGEDAWALEDGQGRVVFYLKTETSCRLHIQFGPSATDADRRRNRDAMMRGLGWLEATLAANSFREMVFDSTNPALIQTAKRRLGFVDAAGDLRRSIPIPEPQRSPVGSGSATPTAQESEAD